VFAAVVCSVLIVGAAVLIAAALAPPAASIPIRPSIWRFSPACPLFVVTTNAVSERVVAETGAITAAVAAWTVDVRRTAPSWRFTSTPLVRRRASREGGRGGARRVRPMVGLVARASRGTRNVAGAAAALWPFAAQTILGVIYSRLAVFTVERVTTRAELGVFGRARSRTPVS
jgi:hypothetical protein